MVVQILNPPFACIPCVRYVFDYRFNKIDLQYVKADLK
jgi:hypothetical protein